MTDNNHHQNGTTYDTTPRAAAPADQGAGWAYAYQESQRQTAEAHAAFQNAMAQAHIAFLQSSERAVDGLVAMATGGAVAGAIPLERTSYVPQGLSAPAPAPAFSPAPTPQPPAAPAPQPAPARRPAPAPQAQAPAPAAPAPAPASAPAPTPQAAPAPAPAPAAAAPAGGIDPEALLLEVVAEKTGYPAEMLSMDMSLEADLGIDSIKRVEILSAMMKQQPDLPKVDTKQMAALNTLGEIVAYMNDHIAGGAAGTTSPKASSAATP